MSFILYNPLPNAEKWKPDDKGLYPLVGLVFAWHCAAVILTMFTIAWGMSRYHNRISAGEKGPAVKHLLGEDYEKQTLISMDEDN